MPDLEIEQADVDNALRTANTILDAMREAIGKANRSWNGGSAHASELMGQLANALDAVTGLLNAYEQLAPARTVASRAVLGTFPPSSPLSNHNS